MGGLDLIHSEEEYDDLVQESRKEWEASVDAATSFVGKEISCTSSSSNTGRFRDRKIGNCVMMTARAVSISACRVINVPFSNVRCSVSSFKMRSTKVVSSP